MKKRLALRAIVGQIEGMPAVGASIELRPLEAIEALQPDGSPTRSAVCGARQVGVNLLWGGQRPTQPPTYTHIPYVTAQERLSRLPNAASQPRGQPPHRLS